MDFQNAALRPGRFDRRVTVDRPDWKGRQAILTIHSRTVPLAPDVDLVQPARMTTGMVGAEMLGIDDPRPGLTFARYQLRPAVSAPGSDSASISLSMSGLRNPFRNSEKPFREITRSENPRIWKKAMYQDRRPWELVSSARWNARG